MPADVRIAIVGCGAVTEQAHLPAFRRLGVTPSLLIDPDIDRARGLADEFGVRHVAGDHTEVASQADAAIVASPNNLHAAISCDLLLAGVHVLVEKPMALTYSDCLRMIAAAEDTDVILMVGLRRRFLHTGRWMKRMLAEHATRVDTFDFRNGSVFGWQVTSNSLWRRESAGGGVLMDIGAHVLDQLQWWLGPVEHVEYADDAFGGVEADCELSVVMRSGARGTIELSRTRNLRNSAIVRGFGTRIEVALDGNWAVHNLGGRRRMPLFPRESWFKAFDRELQHWLEAVAGRAAPATAPRDAAESIRLIEACYAMRRPLDLPWLAAGQT